MTGSLITASRCPVELTWSKTLLPPSRMTTLASKLVTAGQSVAWIRAFFSPEICSGRNTLWPDDMVHLLHFTQLTSLNRTGLLKRFDTYALPSAESIIAAELFLDVCV